MAKTDYITSGNYRLMVYQSDILNPSAADPYVQVSVYLQAYCNGSGARWTVGSWSGSLLSGAYTSSYGGDSAYTDGNWTGWKTIATVFYQKGIWSVNKTRTSFAVSFSTGSKSFVRPGSSYEYPSISGTVSMQAWPASGTKDTASIASSMTMGSSYTITITHKTTGNKNTLTWKFGSKSGTLLSKSTSTSVSFTPATSLGSQIPSSSSGTLTFTLTTYNSSGTSLGSTTYSATLSVPSYSLSTPTVSAAKNTYTTIDAYVANKTKTRFTLSGLPSGSYGATVTGSYVIKLGTAQQTSGTKTGTSSSNVDYTASAAGTLQLTYTIKDSRGKTASKSASVTYVANQKPTISFSADRDSTTLTNWAGTATGTYWNITGNTATITFSEGTAGTPTIGSGAFSCGVSGSSLPVTSSRLVTATITDSLGNTATKKVTIATVFAYMEATPDRVIAIGRKASTDVSDRVEIGLPAFFDSDIAQTTNGAVTASYPNGVNFNSELSVYSSRGTINYAIARKWGNFRYINIVFTSSHTGSNSPRIIDVGADNVPSYGHALHCIDVTSGASDVDGSTPCKVGTSGGIYAKSVTSGHQYVITGMYFVGSQNA